MEIEPEMWRLVISGVKEIGNLLIRLLPLVSDRANARAIRLRKAGKKNK